MTTKRVLVYPCGTEIALEIHKALRYAKGYELIGGVDNYDHGRFVYRNIIEGLPFIKDDSEPDEIIAFERKIAGHGIDFIYPAMDGVIAVFAKYRNLFKKENGGNGETLIISNAAEICRSKRETYRRLQGIVPTPILYDTQCVAEIDSFPVFVKPDKGQGSVGARKINTPVELSGVDFTRNIIMEFLPGQEYTVDCFTNGEGRLIYARGRGRKRIKDGISVNAVFEDKPEFQEFAEKINGAIKQKGGWFFQLKEDSSGQLRLLEVAARIAGASAISRNIGANLPLMTLDVFNGVEIEDVALNDYDIELDRALKNVYKIKDLAYSHVYIDYDDTIVLQDGKINLAVVMFLYQCINKGVKITLLSKHEAGKADLEQELKKHRISAIFDEVIHISRQEQKCKYISRNNGGVIFIDDSYGERKAVKDALDIPVFDTHMIECLLED